MRWFREACTRCRFLRVDPVQHGRLERGDLAEPDVVLDLGEPGLGVRGHLLEESLTHLRCRRPEAEAHRTHPSVEFS